MTKRQFIIASFLKKLGILRKQKRLLDASTEHQLLKEAEEILGRSVWQNVRDLEEYKTHYQTIHDLQQEKNEYFSKIQEVKTKIEDVKLKKETKAQLEDNPDQDVINEYEKQKSLVQKIKSEQSDISNIASNIKRSFDATAAKLQTMLENGADQSELDAEKAKIKQLKYKFAELKDKKIRSDEELAKQSATLREISKSTYKDSNNGEYGILAKANQVISSYHSKIGLIENKMIIHYNEIGQRISKECFTKSECRKAVQGKFNLCKIIKALRQSLDFNHALADR